MTAYNTTLSATATANPTLRRVPSRVLASQGASNLIVGMIMFGADTMDVISAARKWFVTGFGGFSVRVERRFKMKVKGRPGGY